MARNTSVSLGDHEAFGFVLGALAEAAQPAEIAVASGLEQEGVDLMVGDAAAGSGLIRLAQSEVAGAGAACGRRYGG